MAVDHGEETVVTAVDHGEEAVAIAVDPLVGVVTPTTSSCSTYRTTVVDLTTDLPAADVDPLVIMEHLAADLTTTMDLPAADADPLVTTEHLAADPTTTMDHLAVDLPMDVDPPMDVDRHVDADHHVDAATRTTWSLLSMEMTAATPAVTAVDTTITAVDTTTIAVDTPTIATDPTAVDAPVAGENNAHKSHPSFTISLTYVPLRFRK